MTGTERHGDPRLRVLIISPFLPYPLTSGWAVRTYNLARAIAQRHDVTLLSHVTSQSADDVSAISADFDVQVINHPDHRGLRRRAAQIQAMVLGRPFDAHLVRSNGMQQAIDDLCAARSFDLIQLESCTLAQFRFPPGVPIVIDEHNVEYELRRRLASGERSLLRRAYNYLEYLRYRSFEQRAWLASDGCSLTSARELPEVRRVAPRLPVAIVANGVDLDSFSPSEGPVDPDTVVFNASFDYRPNADGLIFAAEEIWPLVRSRRPSARLLLIGNMPPELGRRVVGPGVEILGRVDDLQSHLSRAAVVVVPLRLGAGTRLKVVEGLAMAKAMVSTTLGCEGVPVRDGEHLLIGDDAASFAARVVELLEQPQRGEQLGRAGRLVVEQSYSWELAGKQLEQLYGQALAGRKL